MKKGISILVSLLLLGSGLQLSIDRHFCGGKIADVKVSLTGKIASCGMEDYQSDLIYYPVINKNCCEDEVILYSIDNNFYPEYNNRIPDDPGKLISQTPLNSINFYYIQENNLLKFILPPGNDPASKLTQSVICVFRI